MHNTGRIEQQEIEMAAFNGYCGKRRDESRLYKIFRA
jgi:hypothetical protein